jgi:hypothetical protein
MSTGAPRCFILAYLGQHKAAISSNSIGGPLKPSDVPVKSSDASVVAAVHPDGQIAGE